MKHDFGEQTTETHSKRLASDTEWLLRWFWYKKTGKPPIDFEDFTPHEIAPFLNGIDRLFDDNQTVSGWGTSKILKAPTSWDEPVQTGDPLIDKWEKELAEGLSPNLSEGLEK